MSERAFKRRRVQQDVVLGEAPQQNTGLLAQPVLPDAWNDQLASDEVPDDTVVALQLLVGQFPAAAKGIASPFALRSQLYSLVNDRTCVDRQLNELRMKKQVKMLKLPSSVDEYAYMFALDYCAMVQGVSEKQQVAKVPLEELQVFDWLIHRVAPAFTKTSIHHTELVRLLATDNRTIDTGTVTEAHVTLLLNSGLLVRDMQESDVYLFSMAGAGPIVKSLLRQRKDFVTALKRKRHPEIFCRELEKRQPAAGALVDHRFLIRDMIGTNTLIQQQTTSGPLLRLAPRR